MTDAERDRIRDEALRQLLGWRDAHPYIAPLRTSPYTAPDRAFLQRLRICPD